jgi:oxygen-dependent protoporphyrinogen oxidase
MSQVLVVGGGIAGLAAALRLQDRGLHPLVLESEMRVGGRMTTDRVNGFTIDRGVTLIGNRFRHMRRLALRLGLRKVMRSVPFTLGLRTEDGLHCYRAQRPDDMLLGRGLSLPARIACGRFFLDLFWHWRALEHGRSDRSGHLDFESSAEYTRRLGRGGEELFHKVIEPGMEALLGGSLASVSRAVMMQVTWNTIAGGFWNVVTGVDSIPEAIAARVPVATGVRVREVRLEERAVRVEVERKGQREYLTARGVVLAVPGHLVVPLCPEVPSWLAEPLAATRYTKRVVGHVALSRPPAIRCAGYTFSRGTIPGVGALELQHHRVPGRCPPGKGLVSVYFDDSVMDEGEEGLRCRAVEAVEHLFPEVRGAVLFVHLIHWDAGTGFFPVGRLRQMIEVRRRLAEWQAPVELAGDYLDGVASEGALCSGEQAADRLAGKLS